MLHERIRAGGFVCPGSLYSAGLQMPAADREVKKHTARSYWKTDGEKSASEGCLIKNLSLLILA